MCIRDRIQMHRQCHCGLHQALWHACIGYCSGKDHRCCCTHRIASAQNDSGHQLALACRQDDVPDCIPSGTSQCIRRLHHLGPVSYTHLAAWRSLWCSSPVQPPSLTSSELRKRLTTASCRLLKKKVCLLYTSFWSCILLSHTVS